MKNANTKKIATMAVLLAICLAAQYFKSISQFITGPIVNATIILATLMVGLIGGLILSVLSPVCAMLFGFAPIMQLVPQMVIAVAIGNMIISLCVCLLRKRLIVGLVTGSVLKAAALWLMVSFLIIPFFASALPIAQQIVVKAMFSYNQLITAAIGSLIAYLIYKKINKVV